MAGWYNLAPHAIQIEKPSIRERLKIQIEKLERLGERANCDFWNMIKK
jgi:hypothetical protein